MDRSQLCYTVPLEHDVGLEQVPGTDLLNFLVDLEKRSGFEDPTDLRTLRRKVACNYERVLSKLFLYRPASF